MTTLRAAALSDIGKVRARNEDRCLFDDQTLIFGVADGVGGMPFGGEAAQTAHDTICGAFRALGPVDQPELGAIVQAANRAVAALGRMVSPGTGIATTLTFGSFRGERATIAHVGDSRAYAWHQRRFSQLTHDHTVEREAQRSLDLADLLRRSSADRHALTRCLGPAEALQIDLVVLPLRADDRYLFCTDGLTNHVRDDEIAALLRQAKEPGAILQELVALALRRGGSDNVSGVMVCVD
jgi:serine/threonine protein phosphatase PrpC